MLSALFKATTEVEKKIGYKFRNRSLLEEALTHRSYRFENSGVDADNERLEFLGDSVLGLILSAHLFLEFKNSREGVLTSMRSQVASGKMLAEIARETGLGEYLRLGRGEDGSGGRRRSSLLANALEALLGAAYIDGGLKASCKIFTAVILPRCSEMEPDIWADNPKGKLQEVSQRKWKAGPSYSVMDREGPAHNMTFRVQVRLANGRSYSAKGASKREAETKAAAVALRDLREA